MGMDELESYASQGSDVSLGMFSSVLRSEQLGMHIRDRQELDHLLETERANGRLPIDLSGRSMGRLDLSGIDLSGANLRDADLSSCNLHDANLRGANLRGANLKGANLAGTDLSDSEMDSATDLKNIALTNRTLIGDVRWNGVAVTRIHWDKLDRLGDELDIHLKQSRKNYIAACKYAARSYRGVYLLLRSQGVLASASRFHLREQQLDRYALFAEGKIASWIGSYLLDLVCGYGERPARIFVTYISVIALFSALNWEMSRTLATSMIHLRWYEALVLSLSSFHGRGFFPQTLSLGDPFAIIAAIEAVIGLFIEIILIATFSRRFLGSA